MHIDNEVVNGYVDSNVEFLHKSVESIDMLVKIYDFMWEDQNFCHQLPILRRYGRYRSLGLLGLTYRIFKMFRRGMERHFASGTAISIKQFEFYKLGLFIEKMKYGTETKN